ncbi:protein FAM32A-like [Physella acuta]|uniref:protein FAM32A-like n=1 Tax=Physella acuta TaxID=109671 RepID=UPI0027DB374B|nr:protein FAM32A-like [Physella acuta]XP_059157874.1 protein FAM32A-like [Physella acuta]XP_059157875.1 protein FAM32A-like [Physella acuta]XP_059157877.1 protein FAM32A-like [Physella acuta]XP_059157878.1 protein FAM32A-like [Physella acuta]XP_059157879.1 protein FAM32A-like [Physella acuta]XP_059157880.1 protein FAM32A-like [Physella acuta]XP_059157883.1 protein FAM32A-like [Physella acuta]
MDDEYAAVQKGGLKLKVKEQGGKKKKKKDKEKKKLEEHNASRPSKTKAELAFERAKKKKILQRAFHKERIMEFNQQLDNLTEHFDIPKVSWTK